MVNRTGALLTLGAVAVAAAAIYVLWGNARSSSEPETPEGRTVVDADRAALNDCHKQKLQILDEVLDVPLTAQHLRQVMAACESEQGPAGRDRLELDLSTATECQKLIVQSIDEVESGPLSDERLIPLKAACEIEEHPGERELVEADFAAASPCVKEKLLALYDDDLPPVLLVYDLELAQQACERDERVKKQRSALEASVE